MKGLHAVNEDGNTQFAAEPEASEDFCSLKRSLSRIYRSQPFFHTPVDVSKRPKEPLKPTLHAPQPEGPQNGLHIKIPQISSAAQVALSALKYLPTPVLVLTSFKTVLLANEAMGRLLGLNTYGAGGQLLHDGQYNDRPMTDVLKGQSLSQIGIDMLQNGQPVWVSWEKFLDKLVVDMERPAQDKPVTLTITSEETTPTLVHGDEEDDREGRPRVRAPVVVSNGQDVVHETAVDVVISTQHTTMSGGNLNKQPRSPSHQVQAKMIVTIWKLEEQKYFTLTFTSPSAVPTRHSSSQSHVAATPAATSVASTRTKSPFSADSIRWSKASSTSSSVVTSPSEAASAGPFPPLGPPAKCQKQRAEAPTMFEKITRMKDAILSLETIKIPVFAMWHDESLAFPNGAARRLMSCDADPTSQDGYDFFSRSKFYTADFEREIPVEELPIIELCRSQKAFSTWKVGMIEPETGRRVNYDVSGEGIYDETTGEFLAGMIVMKDVTEYTERLAAQDEENEQQFQLICDTMPQMLWTTTPDGYHDYFSQRWFDYTGLTPKESLGLGWKIPFHADDTSEATTKWAHSLATGEEYTVEYRCRRYDGVYRWMLGRALPLRDTKTGQIVKWFGTCTDIHELVEARQAARRMREQLSNVIKHADTTVFAIDRHRRLTFFEGKMMWDDHCSEGRQEALGHNVYDIISRYGGPNKLQSYREPLERILNGSTSIENAEHYMEGNKRWYRARFVPVLGKKRGGGTMDRNYVDGAIGISMDVTELKEREQENVRLLSNEAAAKEASRLKSNFLANMSHEIRTPIAGIIGMSELMMDTPLDEEQSDFAHNIQRSANALLTVINDILDFSKVESGRLDIEEVQFSLSVVLQDVSKMLSFAAQRKNLKFISNIDLGPSEEVVALGDPGRIRQVLTNLLTNSIKFTPEGEVKLSVWIKRQTDEVVEMVFKVEDTGIGIEEGVKKTLFTPFSQADSSTARKFGGTGLGLTICKNLVDLMHGQITLESSLGNGTTAMFSIPFNKPQFQGPNAPLMYADNIPDRLQSDLSLSCNTSSDAGACVTPPISSPLDRSSKMKLEKHMSAIDNALQKAVSPISGPARPNDVERSKIHVLVVEDNAINQQIAVKTIKNLKFQVTAVWNGKEALEYLLKPSNPRPDIILMDCQMPILDGYRATHLLRHHAPYNTDRHIRAIPVVAMTASAIQGDREKCEKAGMDDYLAKPVKRTVLEKMLLKWVDKATKQRLSSERNRLERKDSCISVEHDSECPGSEIAMKALGSQTNLADARAYRTPSLAPSADQAAVQAQRNAELLGTDILPGVGSDGSGGQRLKEEASERASSLRDDKLLLAGGTLQSLLDHARSEEGETLAMELPSHNRLLLTEANISKLKREHEQHDADLANKISPNGSMLPTSGSGESTLPRSVLHPQLPLPVPSLNTSSPPIDGVKGSSRLPNTNTFSDSMSPNHSTNHSVVGSLRSGLSPGRKKPWGPTGSAVRRNDSDFSERTAVPGDP